MCKTKKQKKMTCWGILGVDRKNGGRMHSSVSIYKESFFLSTQQSSKHNYKD